MVTTDTMVLFWGDESIYSNFYPVSFIYDDIDFKNSEAAYMYKKALYFKDYKIADTIIFNQEPPIKAKKLGRKVVGYDDVEWSKVRYNIMLDVVKEKFFQNVPLMKEILSTEDKLIVEASPYDEIWGVGLSEVDPEIHDVNNWTGMNLLGNVLMEVRDEIRHWIYQTKGWDA